MQKKINSCVLRSQRLFIRPHQDGDEASLNQAVLDSFKELHRWMQWAVKPPTLKETKDFVDFARKCWDEADPSELPLLIFDTTEKNLLGAASFNAINWQIPSMEFGYWVNGRHTGHGYITEATNMLIQYAFSKWNAKRIEIRCDSENTKSAAIPKRLGFSLEAHFKNHRIQPESQQLSGTLVFARYDSVGLPEIDGYTYPQNRSPLC